MSRKADRKWPSPFPAGSRSDGRPFSPRHKVQQLRPDSRGDKRLGSQIGRFQSFLVIREKSIACETRQESKTVFGTEFRHGQTPPLRCRSNKSGRMHGIIDRRIGEEEASQGNHNKEIQEYRANDTKLLQDGGFTPMEINP